PGVLVAQGGTAHGFSLYINRKLQPAVALRIDSTLHTFVAGSPLPKQSTTLALDLRRSGKLTLTSNSQNVLTAKAPSALNADPADALSVGLDSNAPVGGYPSGFPFPNKLTNTSIKIK
ncbi:MAG: arylsulfatase, partial [Verrucomicrobiales bacterium]|nr:arylsulfatase [Verrucomicrobiales bacterium]